MDYPIIVIHDSSKRCNDWMKAKRMYLDYPALLNLKNRLKLFIAPGGFKR